MKFRGVRTTAAWLVLASVLAAAGRADEPAVRQAAPAAAVKPAAVAKPAAQADGKPAVDQPRGEPAGVDVEAFAAPVNRVLAGKLNVKKPAPDDPNAAMTQQYAAQMRPILIAELNFVRQMCELTPEQRTQVRAAGEAALLEAARGVFRQRQPQQLQLPGVNRTVLEPRKQIREAIGAALAAALTDEALKPYREESDRRAAFRRRAAIGYAVSRLDGTLYLTPRQRDEITESLTKNWQEAWESWLMMQVYGDRYFPTIPDQFVVRALNPDQVAVWRGLQKVQISNWSNVNGEAIEDDGWWGGEPLGGNGRAAGGIFIEAGF